MFLALWYHGQFSLPRKTEANHQAYQFFFSFTCKSQGKLNFSDVDLTSTWVGKGRMLPATLMSLILHGFAAIWNTFGRIYGNQIQFGFHTFFIHWWYIFLVVFFLCVWERYFFWMSITQQWGKNQKANPRHQDASLDSIFSLLLNATEHCHMMANMHGFNFTHRGICLQMTTTFSNAFLSKTADSIQSLIFL